MPVEHFNEIVVLSTWGKLRSEWGGILRIMAIRLGTNDNSLTAQYALGQESAALAKSFERLSSGLRINDASDDPAGLALASQLNSSSRVYAQGARNVNDGISAANIAEGALTALQNISQRQLELATQAANGTNTASQRQALNTEANALVDEYNRIVSTTTINGMSLLDPNLGSILIQAGNSTFSEEFSNELKRAVGDGTFQAAYTFTVGGSNTQATVLEDVNGDGKLDLVTVDESGGDVQISLGNGDGTFQVAKTFQTRGIDPLTVSFGDLNGDGKLDMITSDNGMFGGGDVSVFIGNGDGTFQAAVSMQPAGANTTSVLMGDFNGDGKLDIISLDNGLGHFGNVDVSVFLGNGDGTFQAAVSFQPPSNTDALAVGDFNGDGRLDIVAADGYGASVLLGNGNGTFEAAMNFQTAGETAISIAVGDFNGDGNLDVVTADLSGDVSVFLGNSDGTLQAAVSFQTTGEIPNSVSLGDLNGDGRLDIVTTDQSGDVSVLLNNGDGTFASAQNFQTGSTDPGTVAIGDLNSDGRLDIVMGDYFSGEVRILTGNGGYSSTSEYLNLSTNDSALAAQTTVNGNLSRIEAQLGVVGATTSRFQFAFQNLQVQSQNYLAAAGQIQDVDVAEETANLLRQQILQQETTALLAQANQEPALVLKLLG